MVKIKSILIIISLLLAPLVSADTTFFDSPDSAFIVGNSPAIPTADSGATGEVIVIASGGDCSYEWNCTNWSECLPSGKQTRNCTNIGTCPDWYKIPEIEQNCTYSAPEVEKKEGKKENGVEEEKKKEAEKQNETGGIVEREPIMLQIGIKYLFISLIIISIIFYLNNDYFKKLVKKIK